MKKPTFLRYSEFWFTGYAFQAVVVFGMGGILMPIVVNNAGNAAKAGTVMAAFYFGQLLAPLMGKLTDRTGWHKQFYLSGYVLLAIGLGLFPFAKLLWFWMALAFIQGVGSGTSNTVSTMFIVEYKPKAEWDLRIGWIQTFYGIGQCAGLVLVSFLQARPEVGLLVSAALMAPGLLLGAVGLPSKREHKKPETSDFDRRAHRPPRAVSSMLNRYEGEISAVIKHFYQEWFSWFGLYILGWFFVMLATWLIGVLFPLLMKEAFGISYKMSSIYYAVGAAIGIFAYAPSGSLGKKIGDGWVVMIGTLMTLVSLVPLSFFAYVHTGLNVWLIPIFYVLIPIGWSPLIVGGNAWTAVLATFEEGEALGFFNASTAIASVLAAFLGGLIAHHFGYGMIVVVAAVSTGLSIICFIPLLARKKKENVKRTGSPG